ncbi:MAG: FtsX-like permease family protein [Candidatus Bathyarchaeota archaeon]|nr:FtsX-like permease family protein [Candidatus Bathyarchaeota archaeon]
MNPFQIIRLSFEALKERRVRTGLTILMVIMGASLLVAINGTGNGFTNFVDDQFSSLGANVLIITARSGSITIDDTLAVKISQIEGVQETIPYVQQVTTLRSQGTEQTTIVQGIEQTKLPLLFPTLSFASGTYVSQTDNLGVVLGNELSRLPDKSGVFASQGGTVTVVYQGYENQKPAVIEKSFVVRGQLNYLGSAVIPADQMSFVSTSAAQKMFNRGDSYDGLYVISLNPEANSAVLDSIREQYGNDLVIISPQTISETINRITDGVYLFINLVALVSLLVASVGIITTLQTSVMERIKEIGLLKALGYNRQLILSLFLYEATIIGIIGGIIGVVFGVGLSYGMSAILGQNITFQPNGVGPDLQVQIIPSFDIWYLIFTWGICVCLSMISGLYPSWRASRLDPVVALKTE